MRPSAAGLGNISVRNVHFLICIPDNFPPDKFQIGQFPLGQVPDRTSSPVGNLSGGNLSASRLQQPWVHSPYSSIILRFKVAAPRLIASAERGRR